MRQHHFWQAHEFIAVNAGLTFEALAGVDSYLCGEPVVSRINWCTDSGGKPRFEQCLTTDDDKNALALRISRAGLLDKVQFASSHGKPWYSSTSCASWFSRSAQELMISMSLASRLAFSSRARYAREARSIKAERLDSIRSMVFSRSSGSVIEVLTRTR